MSIDELEAEALKLAPAARARLAERLLESLETLSDEENARLWADEAQRRMVVSFHELARLELNEAARYYESESTGLGQVFITEVERCANEIVQYPEAGVVVRGSIRRRLIRRFPYGVVSLLVKRKRSWPSRARLLPV
jgi:hypothetical protein